MGTLPPTIRIEVDDMKYSIMHYLSQHHRDVEAAVEKQIESAIENYDFEAVVAQGVRSCLSNAIKSYFEYGNGRGAIEQAVWASLDGVLDKEDNA